MPIRTAHTQRLGKVASYLKNVGKSVGYASIEVLKSTSPSMGEFMDTNKDLFKEVYKATVNYKQTFKAAETSFRSSKIYAAADAGFKNLKEDIRTGQFYNKRREEEFELKSSGEDFDDDFNFDFDFDSDDSDLAADDSRAQFMAKSFDESSLASAQMTSTAVAKSAEFAVAAGKANTKVLYAQNQNILNSITTGFTSMKLGLDTIVSSLTGPLQTHMENSKVFYETSTKLQQENNAILKELLEMQRNLYKAKDEEYKRAAYDEVVGAEGTPDLRQYAREVRKNLKTALGPEFEMLMGDSMGENSNLLMAFVGSPLKMLPMMLVKTVIPATVRSTMKAFDEGISSVFANLVTRLNKLKSRDNPLAKFIGNLFGLDIEDKTSVDTSKFKRDNMSWNGIAQKTLVDVIPGYLRKIEAHLSGGEERMFDYNTGRWKRASQVKKEYDDMQRSAFTSATSEMRDIMVKAIKDLKAETYQQEKDMLDRMDALLKVFYEEGGGIRFEKRNADKDDHRRAAGDALYEYLMGIMSLPQNRNALRRFDQNVISAKQNRSRNMRNIEENGGHLLSLFDDSMAFSSKNPTGRIKTPGIVDKHGHDALFYLRNILGELMYQRKNGVGGGSIRRRGGGGSFNMESFMNENIPKSEATIERERQESEKAGDYRRLVSNYKGGSFNPDADNAEAYMQGELRRQQILAESKTKVAKEQEQPIFLDELLQAGTFGDKMKVIGRRVKGLKSKPATWLNAIITKADQRLFDFFFDTKALGMEEDEDGNKITGFLDYMISRTKETFQKLNDYIDEHILQPLKKKFMPLWDKLKEKAQPYKEAIKARFGWARDKAKGALSRAYGPIFNRLQSGDVVSASDAAQEVDTTVQNSAGGRYVTKYGLTMVSPGEIIIPSSYDKGVQNRQLRYEVREKNKLLRVIREGKIAHNAAGTQAAGDAQKSFKDTALDVASSVSGASKEQVQKVLTSVSNNAPDVVASGALGGALGLLVGGPLLGAAAGVATSIVGKSKTLQGILFGSEENDDGLISKDLQNKFKKLLPDLETYGIAGAITGLITPFGPIGGLMIGSAVAYAKNNNAFMEKMFGKLDEDGNRDDSGIIKPGTVNRIKKAAPRMGIGAVAGMMLGPFGLVGNMVLGAGVGFASTTNKFKDLILGKEDENGERHGGIAGAVKNSIIEPLKAAALDFKDAAKDFFRNNILKPLENFVNPFMQMIQNTVTSIGDRVSDFLNGMFEKTIGVPLHEAMENLIDKMTNIGSKILKAALFVPKTVLTAPFKILGGIGNTIRNSQINRGTASDMTASERLAFRGQHRIRNRFSRWTGADKTLEMDMMMANMSGDTAKELYEAVGQYVDRDKWSDTRRRDTINRTGDDIVTYLNENKGADGKSLYNTLGFKNTKEIRRAMATGDADLFRKTLASVSGKGGAKLSAQQQAEMFRMFSGRIGDIKNYANMQGQSAKSREELMKDIQRLTGKKIDEKGIKNLYRNLGREIKADKDGIRQADYESEDMAKLSNSLQANANDTADRMIAVFRDTNKILKMMAEHMTGEKIDVDVGESTKVQKAAENIGKSDQQVAKTTRVAEKTNETLTSNSNTDNAKLKSKLSYAFGSDYKFKTTDLTAIPPGRFNKIIGASHSINRDCVDFLLSLNDQEFDKYYKLLKALSYKLDLQTCEQVRSVLSKTAVDLAVKTAKAGYKIKNLDLLLGVLNNIRNGDQIKLLKEYIKFTGITPQTTSDLVKATSPNNPAAVKEKNEVAAKPTSSSLKGAVQTAMQDAASTVKTSASADNSATNAAGGKKAGGAVQNQQAATINKADEGVKKVPGPYGGFATFGENGEPLDDKQTQEVMEDFETKKKNDQILADSTQENATGVKKLLTNLFGSKKKDDDEKEGIFSKLFGDNSVIGGGVGKILKYLGLGAAAAVGISLTGHLSQYWKETVWPGIRDNVIPNLKDSIIQSAQDSNTLLGKIVDKIQSVGEKVYGTIAGVFDWVKGGGLGDLFVNVLFPKLLQGFSYFNENLLAPLVATIIKALPAIGAGILKGIKSVFSISLFNRKLKDDKVTIDMTDYVNDANAVATNSSTRSKVSSWLGNLSAPKSSTPSVVTVDLSDTANESSERKMEDSGGGFLGGIKDFLGLNKSSNTVTYATDANGELILDENGNPIRTSDYYAKSADTTIAGQIAGAGLTSFAMNAGGVAAKNNIGNVLSKATLKGAVKSAAKGVSNAATGGTMKGIGGMVGSAVKAVGSTAGKVITGAGNVGTKLRSWATGAAATERVDDAFDAVGNAWYNYTDDMASTAAGAATKAASSGASGGLLKKISSSVIKFFSDFAKDSTVVGWIKRIASSVFGKSLGDNVISKALNSVAAKVVQAIGKNAASTALTKIATNLASVAPFGVIVLVGQFVSGIYNAESIFGVAESLGWGYKIAAGIINVINNKITFGLIPTSTIVDIVLEYILPLFGIDDTELQQQRDEAYKMLDEWNMEHPEEQYDNLEDFLNKDKITTKVGNFIFGKKNSETGKREGGLINSAKEGIKGAASWVGQKASAAGQWVGDKANAAVEGVKSAATWVGDKVSGFIYSAKTVGGTVGTVLSEVLSKASAGKSPTEVFSVEPQTTGDETLDSIVNAVSMGGKVLLSPFILLTNGVGLVVRFVKGMVKMITYVMTPVGAAIKEMFSKASSNSSLSDIFDTEIEESGDIYGDTISGAIFNVAKVLVSPVALITKGVAAVKEAIQAPIEAAKKIISNLGVSVVNMFTTANNPENGFTTAFSTQFQSTGDGTMDAVGNVVFTISKILFAPSLILGHAVVKVKQLVGNVIEAAKTVFNSLGTSIFNMFTTASQAENSVGDIFSTEFVTTGDGTMDAVGGAIFNISKVVLAPSLLIGQGIAEVKNLIGKVIDGAKNIVSSLKGSVSSFWDSAMDASKSLGDIFATEFGETGNAITDKIGGAIFTGAKIVMAVPALVGHGVAIIKDKVTTVIDAVKKIASGDSMDKSDRKKIDSALEGETSVFDSDYWTNADYSDAGPLGPVFSVTTTISKIMNAPVAIIKSVFKTISDAFNGIKDWFGDTFGGLWSWIKGFFSDDDKEQVTSELENAGSGRRFGRGRRRRGGSRVYQEDPSISGMRFGSGTRNNTIGDAGCGPVAATNLINQLGGSMDIGTAANYAVQNGYKERNGGTDMDYFNSILGSNGYSTSNSTSRSAVRNSLRRGKPVVLLGNDGTLTGPFGDRNHFITAKGYDSRGNIIVDDPDSPNGSLTYSESSVLNNMQDSVIVNGYGRRRRRRFGGRRRRGFGTTFPKYALNESQITDIATMITGETGGKDPVAAQQEASQLANLSEVQYGKSPTPQNLINSLHGGWYATGSWSRGVQEVAKEAVRTVLVNGQRVLPRYVTEHDMFPGDIKNAKNRSEYKAGDPVSNIYGGNYKFYTFFGKDKTGDIAGYYPQYYNKYKDDQPYGASSTGTSASSSSSSGGTTSTIFSQLTDLGKSIVKGIYGEDVYNAFFGSDAAANTSGGTTTSGGNAANGSLEAFVQTALNEDGYLEKASNSQLDSKTANAGGNNWTKYGDLTGTNGQAWCAAFVSWCAKQAGLDASVVPRSALVATFRDFYKNKGRWSGRSATPKRGDIVVFGPTGAKHIGIVTGVQNGQVKTIEGNTSDKVAQRSYPIGSSEIFGYGSPDAAAATGTSGMEGTTATTNALGRRRRPKGYSRRGFGHRRIGFGPQLYEDNDTLLKKAGVVGVKEQSLYNIISKPSNLSKQEKYQATNAISGTGRRRYRRATGYGPSYTVDYSEFLSSIVNILVSIANNTQVLNNIMNILSEKLGINLSADDVQTIAQSSADTASAKAKLNTLLQNQKTTSGGVSSFLNNTSTAYLVQAMESIASQ